MDYRITSDGLLKKDDYVVPPFEVLSKIPEWVMFEDGLTFRQLLTFFNNYPDLHFVFPELKNVSNHVYDTFVGKYSNGEYLSVYHTCTLSWTSKTVKDMNFVKDDPDSKFSTAEFTYEDKEHMFTNIYSGVLLIDPTSKEKRFSITFTPITELLDLPIQLGTNDYSVGIEKEYKSLSTPMDGCSLYNLIDAVMDSVDFFGDEDRKREELDHLKDILADINDDDMVDLDLDEDDS